MNTEAAMELQIRLAKEALAMLVIHPTFDVQLYRESIMEIGEAWELPADATLEALALIEHERLAIQKAGEGGVVQHILPEEELPMHATGTETLDNVWDLFETSLRTESTKGRTVLYNMARTLEETQNLLDWIEKNGGGKTGVTAPDQSDSIQPSRPTWGGSSFFPRVSPCEPLCARFGAGVACVPAASP